VLRRVFEANVIAPLGVLQAVSSRLAPDARVINVTSDAAANAYAGWGGYGASKAALEQWSAVFAAENPSLRVYWVDPGDLRTDMQQAAYPGEDIGDRPLPETVVPAFVQLLEGDLPSGRYEAAALRGAAVAAP
jgi:NAD(P)-dependent dehydrogenase (short-subunit alcohol dehydrogenase family)